MNTDSINDLIRLAQVLKVRCGILADDLAKNKRGPLAGRARKAGDQAQDAERKLASILSDILG